MRRAHWLSAAIAATALPAPLQAESPQESFRTGQYLRAAVAVAESDAFSDRDMRANAWNFLGLHARAEAEIPEMAFFQSVCPPDPPGVVEVDALAAIQAELDRIKPRVVMLNEAHYRSLNRAFAHRLLIDLHARGFRVLAVETLSLAGADSTNSELQNRDGFYSNEAAFADFLRTAKALNFDLVAYEAIGGASIPASERWSWRERQHAENLIARSRLLEDPGVKVFVYAGFGHVNRAARPSLEDMSQSFMAAWFQRLSGLMPMSISQVHCWSRAPVTGSSFGYRVAQGAAGFSDKRNGIDILVRPGSPVYVHGRGAWMTARDRRWVRVPARLRALARPLTIEARRMDQTDDVVPMDRVALLPDAEPRLALGPGRYNVVARDVSGAVLAQQKLTVR